MRVFIYSINPKVSELILVAIFIDLNLKNVLNWFETVKLIWFWINWFDFKLNWFESIVAIEVYNH